MKTIIIIIIIGLGLTIYFFKTKKPKLPVPKKTTKKKVVSPIKEEPIDKKKFKRKWRKKK